MNIFRLAVLSLSLLFVGCASNPMIVSSNQTISSVAADKSQVVFMRSSFLGGAINGSLYDVTNVEPIFIGIIANGTKVSYDTTPGKHVFMVVSEAADFLEADIQAGKSYFSIVTPRMGFWKARFSLWPVRSDGTTEYNTETEEFKNMLLKTDLVENSDKSIAWFNKHKDDIKSKYREYMTVWKKKSAEDLAKRTLNPNDGR